MTICADTRRSRRRVNQEWSRRRRLILDAAIELTAARGYHGMSMADLGDAVALDRSALYHYFKSRDEILFASVSGFLDAVLDHHRTNTTQEGPWEQLRGFSLAHYAAVANNPRTAAILETEVRHLSRERYEQVLEERARYRGAFIDALREVRIGGAWRYSLDLESTACGLLSMALPLARCRAEAGIASEHDAEAYATLVLSAAGTRT